MRALIIFFICLTVNIYGQEKTDFPLQPGWELSLDFPVYTPDNLWDYINGAADGYLSYGFQSLTMAEYTKGKNSIQVEVYRHKDEDHAFGIYSSERSSDYNFIRIGAQGYQTGSVINFLSGDKYFKIHSSSDKSRIVNAMIRIAESLDKDTGEDNAFPEILQAFPQEGKIANRETFIASNYLGHEFFTGVFTASYEKEDERFSLFITIKSNPEECRILLEKYYDFSGLVLPTLSEGKHLIKDRYNGDIYLVWKGNIIYGIVDCGDKKTADEYLTMLNGNILL